MNLIYFVKSLVAIAATSLVPVAYAAASKSEQIK